MEGKKIKTKIEAGQYQKILTSFKHIIAGDLNRKGQYHFHGFALFIFL